MLDLEWARQELKREKDVLFSRRKRNDWLLDNQRLTLAQIME